MIVLTVSIIVSIILLFCIINKNNFYNKPYNGDELQKSIILIVICIFIILIGQKPMLTSNPLDEENDIYNKYLVDAIIKGQTYIDLEPSEELKALENPYDYNARKNIEYSFDTAYYNGKYYVCFGVVPALLIFVPFKLITGFYLQTHIGAILFLMLSIVVNVLLTIEICKKWFNKIPFIMLILFIISGLISGLYIWNSWRMWVYELTLISGFFFVQLGMLLIIKATNEEKVNLKYVFFSCLSMALAVGCRPTLVLSSALLLPFLFKVIRNISKGNYTKTFLAIIVPYMIVAIPMMIYNYARFGSILEFGAQYQLTIVDVTDLSERYKDIPYGLYKYFLEPPKLLNEFPFIELDNSTDRFTDNYFCYGMISGILFLNLSLVSCIFLFKYYKKAHDGLLKGLMILLPLIGIILGIVAVYMGGNLQRYVVDFFWMFSTLSMIVWALVYEQCQTENKKKTIIKIFSVLIVISCFINFFGTYINSEYGYLKKYVPQKYEQFDNLFSI